MVCYSSHSRVRDIMFYTSIYALLGKFILRIQLDSLAMQKHHTRQKVNSVMKSSTSFFFPVAVMVFWKEFGILISFIMVKYLRPMQCHYTTLGKYEILLHQQYKKYQMCYSHSESIISLIFLKNIIKILKQSFCVQFVV